MARARVRAGVRLPACVLRATDSHEQIGDGFGAGLRRQVELRRGLATHLARALEIEPAVGDGRARSRLVAQLLTRLEAPSRRLDRKVGRGVARHS